MDRNNAFWWQTGVVYEVYVRSFKDSNKDGIGDIKGIIDKLDYLYWLGIKAVWITPVYQSPMKDFGYDISDYEAIDSIFGTMDDVKELLKELHARDMKLIMDIVPNHTSDQHPWFLESRSSKDNPKRDWYMWQDAKNGDVPNNWLSVFGGSAWEWDEATQQYYYHAFLKEQPDLNWRNPEVQKAMLDVMNFWLDMGIDGFRVDVMWHFIKDQQLRDNPLNPNYHDGMLDYDRLLPVYSTDQPEVHDIVAMIRKLTDSYSERLLIAEVYLPINKLVSYYGIKNNGAQLPFNFSLLAVKWDGINISSVISEYEAALPRDAWPNWVLGNHDQPRMASKVGLQQARIAAILLFTLRGTPTVYYGDEIGMRDAVIAPEDIRDPQGLNMPNKNLSRDPCRTPMHWNNSQHAGFSESKPWLPVSKYHIQENVSLEKDDRFSMLSLYKHLLALRQKENSLLFGDYLPVYADQQMIVYIREAAGSDRFLIALNFSHHPCYYNPPFTWSGTIEIATSLDLHGQHVKGNISLNGDEGIVIRVDK